MKRYIIAALLALVLLLPFQSFASVYGEPPEVEPSDVAEEVEPEIQHPDYSISESSAPDNPNVLGTPYDWPDWLGEEPVDPNIVLSNENATEYSESSYGTDEQLAKIEYHLSIISGGVILATCCFWFWLTVYKPLKMFTGF